MKPPLTPDGLPILHKQILAILSTARSELVGRYRIDQSDYVDDRGNEVPSSRIETQYGVPYSEYPLYISRNGFRWVLSQNDFLCGRDYVYLDNREIGNALRTLTTMGLIEKHEVPYTIKLKRKNHQGQTEKLAYQEEFKITSAGEAYARPRYDYLFEDGETGELEVVEAATHEVATVTIRERYPDKHFRIIGDPIFKSPGRQE